MDKILHDPKDPKLWELWYIPYYGSCRILSINRIARPFVCEMAFGAEGLAGSFAHRRKFEATRTWGAGSSPNSYRSRKYRALNCKPIRGSFAFWGWAFWGC